MRGGVDSDGVEPFGRKLTITLAEPYADAMGVDVQPLKKLKKPKKKLCTFFASPSRCNKGTNCRFRHGGGGGGVEIYRKTEHKTMFLLEPLKTSGNKLACIEFP
jgi:hypothetical protein